MIYDGNFDILLWASIYKHLKANIRVISDLGHLSKYFFSKKSQFYNLMCQHRPAATHLVSKPFDPRLPLPLDKWSQNFGPPGKMVPIQFGPWISRSLQPVYLDKGNILEYFTDHLSGGTKLVVDICPWGPKFWGPSVHGDQIGWGLFVQRDQLIRDPLWETKYPGTICIWDQMCDSP